MPFPKDPIDGVEAARLLKISVDNLHQRVHRGLVPAERIGRSLVFDRKLIQKLAAQPADVTISDHVEVVVSRMAKGKRTK
jgi:hypothetical protein